MGTENEDGEARVPDPFSGGGRATAAARSGSTAASVEVARVPNLESSLGHNARLGKRIVEQACVERLTTTRRGRVPENLVDFLNRAVVYFLDADGHVVDLDHVIVVWKEE